MSDMELTREEKDMLEGKHGHAVKKSMEILTALGEIFGAEKLVPVSSVQISGVSYNNLGDAGLEFLEEMSRDGKVKVTTTLNPAGMDMKNWKELGFSEDFAEKQKMVVDAFARMGVKTTCSCVPYFIGNRPSLDDHISWGESSAVTFANSVLGARTNKEGGPSTIASALTGLTPAYGLHLDENRKAKILVEVKVPIKGSLEFGALGSIIGERVGNKIPLITGIDKASENELKSLSAALPTYGGSSLFHIEGITPEKQQRPEDKLEVTEDDIGNAKKKLNDAADVDFVLIGCPHCSLEEIRMISELLKGKKVVKEFWVATARPIRDEADKLGYVKTIEDAGAKFACDTCHVVAPLKGRFKAVATNSAKGVFYGRSHNDFKMVFRTLEDCVKIATGEL